MSEPKFHRCPDCGHDWLECQGEGECAHEIEGFPADVTCDDCLEVRTSTQK